MTHEEEKLLAALEAKRAAESDGKVLRLIPGQKQDATPLVEKLHGLLKQAEAGEFEEFIFVAVPMFRGNPENATVSWSGTLSFRMLGALAKAVSILTR